MLIIGRIFLLYSKTYFSPWWEFCCFWILGAIFGAGISLIFRVIAGLYWLWSPVYWASVRNAKYRRYNYVGFWRGRVLDIYLSEELVKEESTNR